MATQYGNECWCSREGILDYERHGEDAVCDYPCAGDEVNAANGWEMSCVMCNKLADGLEEIRAR